MFQIIDKEETAVKDSKDELHESTGGKVGESKRFKGRIIVKYAKLGKFRDYKDSEHVIHKKDLFAKYIKVSPKNSYDLAKTKIKKGSINKISSIDFYETISIDRKQKNSGNF
jgi:hypothetical protein